MLDILIALRLINLSNSMRIGSPRPSQAQDNMVACIALFGLTGCRVSHFAMLSGLNWCTRDCLLILFYPTY